MVKGPKIELPKGLEEKWKLVQKLKRNGMRPNAFHKKFICSIQTARNWINRAKISKKPHDFLKERGGQPILSPTEKFRLSAAVKKAAFSHQALLNNNHCTDLVTFRSKTQEVREEYAAQHGLPIPKELSVRQSYDQRSASNVMVVTAQEITKAHLAALNDVRMGISTCIAGMAIGKYLNYNPSLFFNMDMSGYSQDGIGNCDKLRIVIDKDQKDILDLRGVPVSTRAPNPETCHERSSLYYSRHTVVGRIRYFQNCAQIKP